MFGWFIAAAVASAIADGSASSVEDYCNQNGCNYDDVYERRRVRGEKDINSRFVGWDD